MQSCELLLELNHQCQGKSEIQIMSSKKILEVSLSCTDSSEDFSKQFLHNLRFLVFAVVFFSAAFRSFSFNCDSFSAWSCTSLSMFSVEVGSVDLVLRRFRLLAIFIFGKVIISDGEELGIALVSNCWRTLLSRE